MKSCGYLFESPINSHNVMIWCKYLLNIHFIWILSLRTHCQNTSLNIIATSNASVVFYSETAHNSRNLFVFLFFFQYLLKIDGFYMVFYIVLLVFVLVKKKKNREDIKLVEVVCF